MNEQDAVKVTGKECNKVYTKMEKDLHKLNKQFNKVKTIPDIMGLKVDIMKLLLHFPVAHGSCPFCQIQGRSIGNPPAILQWDGMYNDYDCNTCWYAKNHEGICNDKHSNYYKMLDAHSNLIEAIEAYWTGEDNKNWEGECKRIDSEKFTTFMAGEVIELTPLYNPAATAIKLTIVHLGDNVIQLFNSKHECYSDNQVPVKNIYKITVEELSQTTILTSMIRRL